MAITAAAPVAGAVPPPPPKTKTGTLATAPALAATRRHLLLASAASALPTASASAAAAGRFTEIPSSGGVKALELREGSGEVPADGDQVAIHYYGRLAAKQGWRFDSTYDHKDATGDPVPFVFTVGSGKVIPGIEAAVKSMRVGGLCRVVIPPSQGYQNTSQEPIPPDFFDRQRLFTTIFNPTPREWRGFHSWYCHLRHRANQHKAAYMTVVLSQGRRPTTALIEIF